MTSGYSATNARRNLAASFSHPCLPEAGGVSAVLQSKYDDQMDGSTMLSIYQKENLRDENYSISVQ